MRPRNALQNGNPVIRPRPYVFIALLGRLALIEPLRGCYDLGQEIFRIREMNRDSRDAFPALPVNLIILLYLIAFKNTFPALVFSATHVAAVPWGWKWGGDRRVSFWSSGGFFKSFLLRLNFVNSAAPP